jgi:hypothetical protein
MKLRSYIVLALAISVSVAARAQTGVQTRKQVGAGLYFNPIVTHVGNGAVDNGTFSYLGPNTTSRFFGGVMLGGFYDFLHRSDFGLGIDVRDSLEHSNGALLNRFGAGARISYQRPESHLRPYIEPFVDLGETRSPDTGIYLKKETYGVMGGLDYNLAKHIDLRVLEVGYGTLDTTSDGSIGGTVPVPKFSLLSFSTGLVFRF